MKDGSFRGFMAAIAAFAGKFKWWGPRTYADPHFNDDHHHQRSRAGTKVNNKRGRKNDDRPMIRRGNLGPPPCEPGSISYHDMLVRKLGRFRADEFRHHYIDHKQNRVPLVVPTPADLAVADWAWR